VRPGFWLSEKEGYAIVHVFAGTVDAMWELHRTKIDGDDLDWCDMIDQGFSMADLLIGDKLEDEEPCSFPEEFQTDE